MPQDDVSTPPTEANGSSSRAAVPADAPAPADSQNNGASAKIANKKSRPKRSKSRPHLKRLSSSHNKLVFSVDDDVDDFTEKTYQKDLGYLEGYSDALKVVLHKRKDKKPDADADDIAKTLWTAEENLKQLEEAADADQLPPPDEEEEEEQDNASVKSSSSSNTIESLNLKDRQAAINATHPFGIKLWKPSLYKKKRSVAARAQEDIHDYDRPSTNIYWGVHLTNLVWCVTVGMFLFILCTLSAVALFVATGFGLVRHSMPYVKLLFKLGKYWLFPFGRFVLLNKDQNYLEEDEVYGRSFGEFHRWRTEEEGRLFFAPPRRQTASNESRPLLKDHKGRSVRDSYAFLDDDGESGPNEDDGPLEEDRPDTKVRFFGRGRWTWSRIMFYLIFYGVLQPIFYFIGLLCYLFVFTIPMFNLTHILCDHLRLHPLALDFELEKKYYSVAKTDDAQRKRTHQSIIMCTYRCAGFHYYKYTIDGTNIFFINLLFAVAFVIFDHYILHQRLGLDLFITYPTVIFCGCLFSTIPLAFFIGQAVASISAQSSMGVGAVINAFFSTIVEIFLYCVALNQAKGKLVEGSMIGSILAGVLLLPGLSMCAGAFKRKTQRYNPRSAGVSSTMLLFGMVTMFTPSILYQIYGSYRIKCKKCDSTVGASSINFKEDCTQCRFIQPSFSLDALYYNVIKPFSLLVALALFLAYVCGLFFTLRTHASLIWATSLEHEKRKEEHEMFRSPSVVSLDIGKAAKGDCKNPKPPVLQLPSNAISSAIDARKPLSTTSSAWPSPAVDGKARPPKVAVTPQPKSTPKRNSVVEEEEEGGGHDAPNWSRNKSAIILLGATLLYAVIAEILVDNVDTVLENYPIAPKFLGLTVFALVPNTTEFINAISFAIGGNVALSMEIGSAYALQVVLIQIPSLVIYSIVKGFTSTDQIFALVFPRWDIIATLISIYLFIYIYAEGKSNYFKGVILCLIYVVVLVGFWLNDTIEELDDGYNTPISDPPAWF